MPPSFFDSLLTKIGKNTPPSDPDGRTDAQHAGPPDPYSHLSALLVGDEDAALPISQLELLGDTARTAPEAGLSGLLIGMPLPGVERVLAAAGFNLAEGFHSSVRNRHLHRLVEEDGTGWHLTFGECENIEDPKALMSPDGWKPTPRADFADWARLGDGRFRRHADGAVRAKPERLHYDATIEAEADWAYDFLESADTPEDLLERLRGMEPMGLYAERQFRALAELVFAAGEAPTIRLLYSIMHDEAEREAFLSRLAERVDRMPEAFNHFLEREPAPQVMQLLATLLDWMNSAACLFASADFRTPGHLWHIDTSSRVGRGLACQLKREALAALPDGTASGGRTLVFAADWELVADAAGDAAALAHPACQLVFAMPHATKFLDRRPAAFTTLAASFPRRLWHRSRDDRAIRLARETERGTPHEDLRLDGLPWTARLHADPSGISEKEIRAAADRNAYADFLERPAPARPNVIERA